MKSALYFAVLFISTGCMPMWIKAKQYSGDGTLRTCSTVFAQGYAIDFPGFDPTQPYAAVYRVSHLPQMSRAPSVCLMFHSNTPPDLDELKARLTATIRVSIADSHGRAQVIDLSPSIAGWRHTSPDLFGIYSPYPSHLRFVRGQQYSVSVSYTPGAIPLPAKEAYFEIEDCAFY
jgi:hypothetical protein